MIFVSLTPKSLLRFGSWFAALGLMAGASASLVAGCTPAQVATAQTVLTDGQLICTVAGTLYKADSVNVRGADASAVAAACASLVVAGQAIVGAVPVGVAAPSGAVQAVPASVPPAVVAAVNFSKT
jgi:hypothetical protein